MAIGLSMGFNKFLVMFITIKNFIHKK